MSLFLAEEEAAMLDGRMSSLTCSTLGRRKVKLEKKLMAMVAGVIILMENWFSFKLDFTLYRRSGKLHLAAISIRSEKLYFQQYSKPIKADTSYS